ncbi:hypothetical protein K438DRAFT_1760410 [Mycena galopus ATCC 62051]|nr:hypothetical protein K438DRAFT_1760410 [Mycena galopus ATCC 62051]
MSRCIVVSSQTRPGTPAGSEHFTRPARPRLVRRTRLPARQSDAKSCSTPHQQPDATLFPASEDPDPLRQQHFNTPWDETSSLSLSDSPTPGPRTRTGRTPPPKVKIIKKRATHPASLHRLHQKRSRARTVQHQCALEVGNVTCERMAKDGGKGREEGGKSRGEAREGMRGDAARGRNPARGNGGVKKTRAGREGDARRMEGRDGGRKGRCGNGKGPTKPDYPSPAFHLGVYERGPDVGEEGPVDLLKKREEELGSERGEEGRGERKVGGGAEANRGVGRGVCEGMEEWKRSRWREEENEGAGRKRTRTAMGEGRASATEEEKRRAQACIRREHSPNHTQRPPVEVVRDAENDCLALGDLLV